MSVRQGSNIIAGVGTNSISNAHTLLDFKWSDHLLNDTSWLRADTFSWQSGQVYSAAYQHLVADLSGATAGSETIAGIAIEYVTATDGHKIVLPTQETAVEQIYQATGVAWYYIVDTTNQRFKLPRSKALTSAVKGNGMSLGIATGSTTAGYEYGGLRVGDGQYSGVLSASNGNYGKMVGSANVGSSPATGNAAGITTDSTKSGIVVERADTDQYKYLYFYVGEYSRSAVEQTAGLNTELFNNKADTSLSNINASASARETIVGWGIPDYTAGVNLGEPSTYQTLPCDCYVTYSANSLDTLYSGGFYYANPDESFVGEFRQALTYTRKDLGLFISKGWKVKRIESVSTIIYYPLKGVSNA